MEWMGMLLVSLRGVNFGFWTRLGRSGQNVIIFGCEGLVKGCTRGNNKPERILLLYIYSIPINWSLLGVCISFGHSQIGPF